MRADAPGPGAAPRHSTRASDQEASGSASALSGLEATLRLVYHVELAATANQTVIAVARTQRFKRIANLHGGTRQ